MNPESLKDTEFLSQVLGTNPNQIEWVELGAASIRENILTELQSEFRERKGEAPAGFKPNTILAQYLKSGEISENLAENADFQVLLADAVQKWILENINAKNKDEWQNWLTEVWGRENLDLLAQNGGLQVDLNQVEIRYQIAMIFKRPAPEVSQKLEGGIEKMLKKWLLEDKDIIKKYYKRFIDTFLDPNRLFGQILTGSIAGAMGVYAGQYGVDLGLASGVVIASVVLASIHPVTLMDRFRDVFSEKVLAFSAAFSIFHLIGLAVGTLSMESRTIPDNLIHAGLIYAPLFAPILGSVLGYLKTSLMSRESRRSEFVIAHPLASRIGELQVFLKNTLRNHDLNDQLEQAIVEKDFEAVSQIFVEIEIWVKKWTELAEKNDQQKQQLTQMVQDCYLAVMEFKDDPQEYKSGTGKSSIFKKLRTQVTNSSFLTKGRK